MHPPRVGIVVLNYRGADDTIACVNSLRELTVPASVVVVDNASADGSVERIAAEAPEVELVVNDRNLGFAAGNNAGIERALAAGAEFVWVLNNDTTVGPGTLAAMLDAAAGDGRIGAVGAVIHSADRRDEVLTWGGGSVSRWTGRTRDAQGPGDRVDYLTGASVLLRADALRDVGLFDDRFFFTWEDVDLCIRLRDRGWRIVVADQAPVWHRWGGTVAPLAPQRLEHHAAGLVVFMRERSAVPWLTAMPMLGWYAWTALRQRRLALWTAAWRGWRAGWKGLGGAQESRRA
jgi:GT2 family glycosyltransferase